MAIKKNTLFLLASLAVFVIIIHSCKVYRFRSNYKDARSLIYKTENLQAKPYLKAHYKNGNLCILEDTWEIDTIKNTVDGNGKVYDINRKIIYNGITSIAIDSIAIFETNTKLKNPEAGRIAALTILAGANIAVTTYCMANPKACYGSCPTFYINENENLHYADAEGFSSAISPSLEYFDVDALNNVYFLGDTFSITMKNEALETHCVNDVKLYAFSIDQGERVYQSTSNDFYLSKNNYPLTRANTDDGDITDLLRYDDKQEQFSLADEKNLLSKEEIYLEFDNVNNEKDLGLVLSFRQTLMTTYLFYNALDHIGDRSGDIFAKMENDSAARNNFDATTKLLGGIDIYLWDEEKGEWIFQDELYETGPIAINRQIISLENLSANSKVKIKIELNKGLWRIDYATLTNIKEIVQPYEISPSSILNKGSIDNKALSEIINTEIYLVTMPGDEYKFNFTLPEKCVGYELFLYTKGYYLEWMRIGWIKDNDLLKLNQMVEKPEKYLKREAGKYKLYESFMEQEFWESRIDTKNSSYNE